MAKKRSSKTKSHLNRSERIERAVELYNRGWTITDVARDLKVAMNTARAYKEIYESQLNQQVEDNPRYLQDIVGNTTRMIQENETVRRDAQKLLKSAEKPVKVTCERCEHTFKIPAQDYDVRNRILKTILSAQESRAKLFGAMGVKAEFVAMVASVGKVQEKLIQFMQDELCDEDRNKLLAMLASLDDGRYTNNAESWTPSPVPALEAESWEDSAAS